MCVLRWTGEVPAAWAASPEQWRGVRGTQTVRTVLRAAATLRHVCSYLQRAAHATCRREAAPTVWWRLWVKNMDPQTSGSVSLGPSWGPLEVLGPQCENHLCAQTGSNKHTQFRCSWNLRIFHLGDFWCEFIDNTVISVYVSLPVLRCWSLRVWGNSPGTQTLCQPPNTKSQTPASWPSMRWRAPPVTCWMGVWVTATLGERGAPARTLHMPALFLETAASVTTATRSRTWLWSARRT